MHLALSYVWGTEDPTEAIYLDEKPFLVRPNLCSFLSNIVRHIKHQFANEPDYTIPKFVFELRPSGPVYIWADAICIDQANLLERNAQVRLMQHIYGRAPTVLVWLGQEREEEDSRFPEQSSAGRPNESYLRRNFWRLANRRYWSRMWVVQEFRLANHVLMLCGGEYIKAIDFYEEYVFQTGRAGEFMDVGTRMYDCAAAPFMQSMTARMFEIPSLAELLHSFRHATCKDPKDRIFALINLLSRAERSAIERFFPDYRLTHEEVLIITLAHVWAFDGQGYGIEDVLLHQHPRRWPRPC